MISYDGQIAHGLFLSYWLYYSFSYDLLIGPLYNYPQYTELLHLQVILVSFGTQEIRMKS